MVICGEVCFRNSLMFLFQISPEVLLRFAEIDVLNVQIVVLNFHSTLTPWFLYG